MTKAQWPFYSQHPTQLANMRIQKEYKISHIPISNLIDHFPNISLISYYIRNPLIIKNYYNMVISSSLTYKFPKIINTM